MANTDRINIFASGTSYNFIKGRLTSAKRGHNILKRKSEVLQVNFREAIHSLIKERTNFMESLQEGFQMIAKAKYFCRNLAFSVLEDVNVAHIKVRTKQESCTGVTINVLECYDDMGDDYKCVGLSGGGQEVNNVKRHYKSLVKKSIEMASLKVKYIMLEEIIKLTNIRINGLEYIIIPRLNNTILYILSQLEENDREEFFRLKLTQEKKQKKTPSQNKRKITVGSAAFLAGDISQLLCSYSDSWIEEDFSL